MTRKLFEILLCIMIIIFYVFFLGDHESSHPENMSVKCIPPYTPLLYEVKLGFTGVYIFFLFFKHCGYLLKEAVLTCTHNLCFEQK